MADNVLPDQFRCSYPFKFCNNERAVKRTGERHKLCQEHRERANKHQSDLAARRRQIKERLAKDTKPKVDKRLSFADIADLLDDNSFLSVDCNEEDLRAVETLLSDEDSE